MGSARPTLLLAALLCSCSDPGRGPTAAAQELATRPAAPVTAAAGAAVNAPPESRPRGPWTEALRLSSAPFDAPSAPSVVVHAGPSFDADRRPLRLVFFLHGWTGCARVLVEAGPSRCREGDRVREGWALGTRFDAAGTDALFVVPQLAFMQRDGSAGRFAERGRFRAFVEELLAALEPRVGRVGLSEVEPVTLLAHSAGFETALAVLTRGEVDVRYVVLFDALYRGVEPFSGWVEGRDDRRLVSLFTGTERTASQNELLARRARLSIPRSAVLFADPPRPLADAIRPHRVVIARSPAGHASVPARHLAEVIEGLGLRTRP